MKTIVIGLDGASYELIDPWIENGDLPNLKEIKENGVHGDLEAQLPPVTSPNWKCYSTGKNPGKLGIFWWENIDWEKQEVNCPDYRSMKNKEIWDYLNQEGINVAIINIPLSFPPKRINGYLISGGPDAGNKGYFYPSDIEEDLKKIEYRVRPEKTIATEEDCRENFKGIIHLIESRFQLVNNLLEKNEKIEFVHLTIFFINVLHHFLWDDDLVKQAWKTIDGEIGELKKERGEDYNLILISDHGSNEIEDVFNINTWLKREGFLREKGKFLTSVLGKIGLTRPKLVKLSESLGVKNFLRKILPNSLPGSIPSKSGGVQREAKSRAIDWENSKAVASGQGPVYTNKGGARNCEKFWNELIEKLENLESPNTTRKIVRKVYKKEEIYSGDYLEKAPDLIVDFSPHIHISGEIGRGKVHEKPEKWRGENKKTGLFAAIGPGFNMQGEKVNVSILDIAPTILHLYGASVPETMDGKVLTEIFREGSEPAKRKVSYEKETPEKERAKTKISELKKSKRI